MESPHPESQPIVSDVISIGDSDDDEPVLSEGQSSLYKKPFRDREMTGELKERPKQAGINGSMSSGAAEILQWRTTTVQEMKMESKKAFRTHWQLYEKNLLEWSERCLALQNENERLKKNLITAALVEMQSKETERQQLELKAKCKRLQEELGKGQNPTGTKDELVLEHHGRSSIVDDSSGTLSARLHDAGINRGVDNGLPRSLSFEDLSAELSQVLSALPNGTDISIGEKLRNLHRDTVDELRKGRLEVASLKSEIGLKQARIEELTVKLSQANAPVTGKSSKVDDTILVGDCNTIAELERVRANLADVSQKLEAANVQKAALQKEIEEHEESKDAMDTEMLALRDKLRQVKEDLEWAETEKENIDEDIVYIMEQSQLTLRDAFRKQKRDIEDLTRNLEEARQAVELHQDDERDLSEQYELLEAKLEKQQEKWQDATKTKQSRINALESEVKKLKQQIKQPRADHISTTKTQQHREVEAKLRICEAEKQTLQEKLDDLEGVQLELKVLKKQFRLAEEKQQRMEKKEAQLRAEKNDYEKQFNTASDLMEKRQRSIDRLTADLKEAQSLLTDKDVKIKGLDRQTNSLSAELEFSADEKIKLEARVVALEEEVDTLNASLKFERDLSSRLKALREPRSNRNDPPHPNETPTRIRNRSVTPGVTPSSSLTSSARKRGPELDLSEEELWDAAMKVSEKIFEGTEGICMACRNKLNSDDVRAVAANDRIAHLVEHHPKVLRNFKAAEIASTQKRPRTESVQL
ncbi:hypothetical protein QFC22_000842 [Naganishia vaughanmartiniae]|uniref:Uncharacterized protein n=1 Tax=Naganishia vaughanmartiniae TaxID=1424756 RepID=A0ACC2XL07_9TREE|nr:hypothetical protein QFC22_000842 [Naganishia vaughanmartiniae]